MVEDDWLIRASIVDDLTTAGCIVLEAGLRQFSDRVAQIEREHQYVLFTNIDLREELLEWDISESCRQYHPAVSVIYTSGVERDHQRKVEGSTFFSKPYDVATCVELLAAKARPN